MCHVSWPTKQGKPKDLIGGRHSNANILTHVNSCFIPLFITVNQRNVRSVVKEINREGRKYFQNILTVRLKSAPSCCHRKQVIELHTATVDTL